MPLFRTGVFFVMYLSRCGEFPENARQAGFEKFHARIGSRLARPGADTESGRH